jgi:hypothetical protein
MAPLVAAATRCDTHRDQARVIDHALDTLGRINVIAASPPARYRDKNKYRSPAALPDDDRSMRRSGRLRIDH